VLNQLVALVPLFPGLAAAWIALSQIASQRYRVSWEKPTIYASLGTVALSTLIMLMLDLKALLYGMPNRLLMGTWFSSGDFVADISFSLDRLSLALGTLIASLCLLTLRFSANYMHRESGFQRYFMMMNLFAGAMLLIVLSGNAMLTFVGWELAGVSSYLLIGYMLDRPVATGNANRAFITNRIGDGGFILGIFLIYTEIGNVQWDQLNSLANGPSALSVGLIAISFAVAALVKSAQLPFSPWIARALEGPTPSSAIFYGALMVHAGVYLLIRLEPVLIQIPGVMAMIAGLGLLSAFYGWVSGLVHSDVKSSLMFSTTAQVGLMFFWCGMGWFGLAAWHLGLHACWRAYQFLHAPSLMFMVSRAARPVTPWLGRQRWLFTAALQRFWVEHIGEALITRPTKKLAIDARAFDEAIVNTLVGLPAQAGAISSLAKWEEWKSGAIDLPEGGFGRGKGLVGKFMEGMAGMLHWFEAQLVLKGGGEGLLQTLRYLGSYLIRIDQLLSQPRYLLLMIGVTFAVVL
jgi:NADH:ubiquinone oxidoreductase subunit 5 (subunit L)/multisubunit Na+/H+ antiporter MnhA subunit